MENKKGSEIFLGVIGVATLLVAIIGATFAYFSASAQSDNSAIKVESAELALGYEDDPSELNTDMIPAEERYALYAATNADWIAENNGGRGLCYDDNGNEICGVYTFTIGNPNFTTTLEIEGKVTVTTNEFKNLKFAIYDENNNQVQKPTAFPAATEEVDLTLDQTLLGSSSDKNAEGTAIEGFDAKKPSTFTLVTDTVEVDGTQVTRYNKRTYKMVIWIEETVGEDQTKDDSGKMFAAGITFSTGGESGGVTGIIAAADTGA